MLKIVSANLWEIIRKKARHAEHRRVAIAYVTDSSLLPLQEGDLLVTDASDASIAGGRTSARTLQKYFRSHVDLVSLPDLHAKVLVLDDWAVVGSANASKHSALIREAAVLSDRPELVGQAEKLVTFFAKAGEPIDRSFIDRILKIPVTSKPHPPKVAHGKKKAKSPNDPRFWLISLRGNATYPGDIDAVEDVSKAIKKTSSKSGHVDWFWWAGKARFPTLAEEGDVVIECWRPQAKVATSKSVRVFRHGRVHTIFQEPGIKAKTFHCVWPADYDDRSLSWSAFLKLAKRAGITRKLSYRSTVELTAAQSSALFELWPA